MLKRTQKNPGKNWQRFEKIFVKILQMFCQFLK